jgi:hypothetical protein
MRKNKNRWKNNEPRIIFYVFKELGFGTKKTDELRRYNEINCEINRNSDTYIQDEREVSLHLLQVD